MTAVCWKLLGVAELLPVGLCQRELGQFFGKVARWANRLYKSDSEVNLFAEDNEFDTAQKFFEFFNEDQQEAKRECTPTVSAWAVALGCGLGLWPWAVAVAATTLTAERCCEQWMR